MLKPKRIAILGSTGSIGTQVLDIISRYPGRFRPEVLTCKSSADLLIEQARRYKPARVVIANKSLYARVKDGLKDLPVEVMAGNEELEYAATLDEIDMVVAAMVGYAGMKPVLAAVKAGKNIALANKETLVVAGELILKEASKTGSKIVPIDSEHSAIFQCLEGENKKSVEKIVLTASGGPFLGYSYEQLQNVTAVEALKHPNWDMGDKITIDSATLMNKGLEAIEAKWLFNLPPEKIEVVIHPQSVIHSLVYFYDGSVKAQMGVPDMRIPILYALSYPERLQSDLPRLDLYKYENLTFKEPDRKIFRNLPLAFEALKTGGNMPCILNAANEVAVHGFLEGKTGFLQMPDVVEHAMSKTPFVADITLEILEASDYESRERAKDYLNQKF
ncbi:MAG TPA: 1-deoxy-D-xylulose-5-phosphate reductoisomerase [Bacteroidales bacterium]|nr:1-deoxy-D-xylulose-5-phosphate reductoisomerase [Bacteroidales bacterium]